MYRTLSLIKMYFELNNDLVQIFILPEQHTQDLGSGVKPFLVLNVKKLKERWVGM